MSELERQPSIRQEEGSGRNVVFYMFILFAGMVTSGCQEVQKKLIAAKCDIKNMLFIFLLCSYRLSGWMFSATLATFQKFFTLGLKHFPFKIFPVVKVAILYLLIVR